MFSKNSYLKSKLRVVMVMLLSVIMALSLFFAAACSDDDDETEKTTSTNDTQTILNGNFEFYSDSDDETYIIYTPSNWSSSTSGNTNYVMNGVLDTSESGWNKISDPSLAETLDYNNNLDEDDDDYEDEYVDYNGMKSRDIPYKNTYAGINGEDADGNTYYTLYGDAESGYYVLDDDGNQITVIAQNGTYVDENSNEVNIKYIVDNPKTHNVITTVEGQSYVATYVADTDETHGDLEYKAGETVLLYADEDGEYYYDSELEEPYESHVLMVHNYVNDDTRYGTAQSYSASTSVTLEPNTAAELSVWVKTSELIYDRNGNTIYEGRGAYIEIEQTVGGSSVDSLYIENIRTDGVTTNNGWVKYTIYVNGCDFAESTITVTLGLGQAASSSDYSETCEGYAFFDDVKCTIYSSIEKTGYDSATVTNECYLTSEEDEKIFKIEDDINVESTKYYYLDLSSRKTRTDISLAGTSVDYTRDSDYYVTSKGAISTYGGLTEDGKYNGSNNDYKVNVLSDSIDTTYDVLGLFDLSDLTTDIANASSYGEGYTYYANTIENVLTGAKSLPNYKDDDNDTALMILSANGAAYTATITNSAFAIDAHSYKIMSFWLKTSDMDDFAAATAALYAHKQDDAGNTVIDTDQVSSLSVDTTGVTFDIGDEDDIYGGWVQCFFYIENTTDDEMTFEMHVSFGNTTIKDTDSTDYKAGYLAITNIQIMDVEEDIYDLTSTGDYAAAFSLTTTDARENSYFDTTPTVESNKIKTEISNPSSYTGVYGGSASIVYSDSIDSSGYDQRNGNDNAGLINQDYWETYRDSSNSYKWVEIILNYITATKGTQYNTALTTWSDIFGDTSIQPLLIANTVRTFLAEDNSIKNAAINYGYIANSATSVSSDSYEIITVKVYVSKGAVAYVYLTESDGTSSDVMTLNLPEYSFWYDNQGNVLDGEPDYDDDDYNSADHVVYYIRDDGLYEDEEGNLFANLNNYSRMYYDQSSEYWYIDGDGKVTSAIYEDVDSDTTYYISQTEADKAASGDASAIQSPHYLIAYDSDGEYTRVFRYDNTYFSGAGYHYIIITEAEDEDDDDEIDYSDVVSNFDTSKLELRYDNTNSDTQMYAVIDARYTADGELATTLNDAGYDANGNPVGETWQTVTFYIHTGDTSYDYTLELWSGARETSGVTVDGDTVTVTNDASMEGSFVAFDYSSVTVDEDTYADLVDQYTTEIINAYVYLLNEEGYFKENTIKDTDQNLSYYKNVFESYMLGKYTSYEDIDSLITAMYRTAVADDSSTASYWKTLTNFDDRVQYYTYSLYDDAGYVPFNAEVAADDETGYDYSYDSYEETLVFLSYYDSDSAAYVTFIDYSASDVTIESTTAEEEEEDEEDDDSEFSVWLLVASIVLVVVLIFTMLSLLVRDLVKRIRRKRINVKNVYSGKRKHYIRKLGLTETTEAPEDDDTTPPEDKTE
ncbi:MAG: hypothetical protein LUI60_03790 [Clostridia bacterium]|nr:hypothetical protein [Clostridia bacterium]